jgi:hypothetical protein
MLGPLKFGATWLPPLLLLPVDMLVKVHQVFHHLVRGLWKYLQGLEVVWAHQWIDHQHHDHQVVLPCQP